MKNGAILVALIVTLGAAPAAAEKAKKPPKPAEREVLACKNAHSFNYGRFHVVEGKDGYRVTLKATATFSVTTRDDLGQHDEVEATFPKAECRFSADHPELVACRSGGRTSIQVGRDKKTLAVAWFRVHSERVKRQTVDGEEDNWEVVISVGADPDKGQTNTPVGAEGMIPFAPDECKGAK